MGLLVLIGSAGVARADSPAAPALAKIDGLWNSRDTAEKELDGLVSQAMQQAPADYDVLWRAARFHCWVGEGASGPRREVEAKQCWDLGAKAAELKPDAVEGNYYAANGAGNYSTEIGIMKALSKGMEGTFNGYLDKAIKIDPGFNHAAPLIAKGRYHYKLPWPKRSYDKSEARFKEALKLEPNSLRAKVWLAEVLVDDGKAKEAKTYIDQAVAQAAAPGSYDPPEIKRVAPWIDPVKKKIDEELK